MARGGRREGAGRKKGSGNPWKTKVVRIPEWQETIVKNLDDIVATLLTWDEQSVDKTSPRWEKAKELIGELMEFMPDPSEIP